MGGGGSSFVGLPQTAISVAKHSHKRDIEGLQPYWDCGRVVSLGPAEAVPGTQVSLLLQPKKALEDFTPSLHYAHDGERLGEGMSIVRRVTSVEYELNEHSVLTKSVREYAHKSFSTVVGTEGTLLSSDGLLEVALMLFLQEREGGTSGAQGEARAGQDGIARVHYVFVEVTMQLGGVFDGRALQGCSFGYFNFFEKPSIFERPNFHHY